MSGTGRRGSGECDSFDIRLDRRRHYRGDKDKYLPLLSIGVRETKSRHVRVQDFRLFSPLSLV